MNDQLRALFPITERAIYLNHAAVSPLPTPTVELFKSQLRDVAENGSVQLPKLDRRERESAETGRRDDRRATRAGRFHAQHF